MAALSAGCRNSLACVTRATRADAATGCGSNKGRPMAWWTRKTDSFPRPGTSVRRPLVMALEPRVMFDGAVVATLAQAEAPHAVAEHAAAEHAPAAAAVREAPAAEHAVAAAADGAAARDASARAPSVTRVDAPADGTYAKGQALEFDVHLTVPTLVDTSGGKPRIAITLDDGSVVYADYVSGSGSDTLLFRHVVQRDELDADGIRVGNAIELHGAGLRDAAGNPAQLELGKLDTRGVRIDAVAPYVTEVEMPSRGDYRAGAALDFTVHTSEAVQFDPHGAPPQLAITLHDGSMAYADYVDGAGTEALRFRYIVQPGVNDAVGISLGRGSGLAGSDLHDAAGNTLESRNLQTAFFQSQVRIDTRAPYIVAISNSLDGPTSGREGLRYVVSFDEAVDGLHADDFSLVSTGNAHGRIASVSRLDSHTYAVLVDAVGGTGSLRLDLSGKDMGITDRAGNALASGGIGTTIQIGGVTPVILAAPAAMPTNMSMNTPMAAKLVDESGASLLDTLQPRELPTIYFGAAVPARAFAPPAADAAGVLVTLRAMPDGVSHPSEKGVPEQPALLPLLQPLPVDAGGMFSMRLPGSLLGTGAHVVQVSMADGRALPPWLLFDPVAGTLEGVAPRDFNGRLPLELVIRDAGGMQRTLPLELVISARDGSKAVAEPADAHSVPEHAAPERAVPMQAKPALEAQFERQRQHATGVDPAALLRQLAVARRQPAIVEVRP